MKKIVAVTFVALLALFTGGCGAFYTLVGALGTEGYFLVFSIPSLMFGVFTGWLAWGIYRQPSYGQSKVEFKYLGHRVRVKNNFYCYDGRNFETQKAVKAYIVASLNGPK